jgi:drug/metabolite transporter (DMT)-like permease
LPDEPPPDRAPPGRVWFTPTIVGSLCGLGAAFAWAAGFVAARHGLTVGLGPADMAFHRFVWPALVVLPAVWRGGLYDLNGVGWGRAVALMVLGGPILAIVSYSGFLLVPLGHGAVIQPSGAAIGGLVLASLILGEPVLIRRFAGAAGIIFGLVLLAAESLTSSGVQGVAGDLIFVCAGLMWATTGTLVRFWDIPARRAASVICVASLFIYGPLHAIAFGFARMLQAGLWENLLQVAVQGGLAGPLAIHLYARAVILLGAGRAAAFPAMVPPATLLIGFLFLGEVPTLMQFLGLGVVIVSFRFVLKN